MNTWTKDPAAELEWSANWAPWLADGETISTSTWTVVSGDVVIDSETEDGTTATVWLSAGTAGTDARVVNQIVTTGARTDERTVHIRVRDR